MSSWPPGARWAVQSKVGTHSFRGWARRHHRLTCRSRLGRHRRARRPSSRDWSGRPAATPSGTHRMWYSDRRASVRRMLFPWRWRHRADSAPETSPSCNIRSAARLKPKIMAEASNVMMRSMSVTVKVRNFRQKTVVKFYLVIIDTALHWNIGYNYLPVGLINAKPMKLVHFVIAIQPKSFSSSCAATILKLQTE